MAIGTSSRALKERRRAAAKSKAAPKAPKPPKATAAPKPPKPKKK